MSHSHSHDGASHSHSAVDHGHTHEILDGPGSYVGREMPIIEGRDWEDRAFTVGIGGYAEFLLMNLHMALVRSHFSYQQSPGKAVDSGMILTEADP